MRTFELILVFIFNFLTFSDSLFVYNIFKVLAITSAAVVLANPSDVRPSLLRGVIPPLWGKSGVACSEDYSPCTCELTSNGLEVTCLDVPVNDIRAVFFRTRALDFYSVTLRAASVTGSVDLPFDLLSNKVTQRLSLQCPPTASPPLTVTIDERTFEFTRRTTTFFEIKDCDLASQVDFAFFNGFDVLDTLRFERMLNIASFATLPALDMRALKQLEIIDSTGLGGIVFPDLTPARLERLYLDGNGLVDADINGILVSVGSSSSVNSLQTLTLSRNLLQKVPRTGSLSQLSTLDLASNQISFVSEFALNFPVSTGVKLVSLKDSAVTAIQDGAFVGNYSIFKI